MTEKMTKPIYEPDLTSKPMRPFVEKFKIKNQIWQSLILDYTTRSASAKEYARGFDREVKALKSAHDGISALLVHTDKAEQEGRLNAETYPLVKRWLARCSEVTRGLIVCAKVDKERHIGKASTLDQVVEDMRKRAQDSLNEMDLIINGLEDGTLIVEQGDIAAAEVNPGGRRSGRPPGVRPATPEHRKRREEEKEEISDKPKALAKPKKTKAPAKSKKTKAPVPSKKTKAPAKSKKKLPAFKD